EAIAADGAGNLFVADTANHTIRKIVIATGAVSTFAGVAGETGSAGGIGAQARFNAPSGIASDGVGDLYVADTRNQLIRLISLDSGDVVGIAGAVAPNCHFGDPGRLCFPRGVAVESGRVYIANTSEHAIAVLSDGLVPTLVGLRPEPGSNDGT